MSNSLRKFKILPIIVLALSLGSCQAVSDLINGTDAKDLIKQDGFGWQYDIVQLNSDIVGDVKDEKLLYYVFQNQDALDNDRKYGFEVYSGKLEVRPDEEVSVKGYRFATGGRAFVLVDEHGYRLQTGGLKFNSSSPLPSGVHIYKGYHFVQLSGQLVPNEGKFLMSVNVDDGTGKIDSKAGEARMWGGFDVNVSKGTLDGARMNVLVANNRGTAYLSGRFHGNGGTGVSGSYKTTISGTMYRGGIAGDRGVNMDTPDLSIDDIETRATSHEFAGVVSGK